MCQYVYVCVLCEYVCVFVYVCVTCVCVRLWGVYVSVGVYVCVLVRVCVGVCIRVRMGVYVSVFVCVCVCNVYMCVYMGGGVFFGTLTSPFHLTPPVFRSCGPRKAPTLSVLLRKGSRRPPSHRDSVDLKLEDRRS